MTNEFKQSEAIKKDFIKEIKLCDQGSERILKILMEKGETFQTKGTRKK